MTLVLALIAWVHARPLALDPARGSIRAHARASLHDFEIEATAFSGVLDPTEGTGTLELAVGGLTTGVGPRDARMRGWCLDEGTHPLVRYSVRRVDGDTAGLRAGVGSGELVLQGDMQIRETTRTLAVPASYAWEGGALRLRGRVPLRWGDWGIPDPAVAIATLGPELTVAFDVLTVPAPEPAATTSAAGAPGEGVAEGTPPRLAPSGALSGARGEDASAEGGAAPGAASTGPRPRRSASNADREGGQTPLPPQASQAKATAKKPAPKATKATKTKKTPPAKKKAKRKVRRPR